MNETYEHFSEGDEEYYRQLIEEEELKSKMSEEELFLQILEYEREESLDPDFKNKLKK